MKCQNILEVISTLSFTRVDSAELNRGYEVPCFSIRTYATINKCRGGTRFFYAYTNLKAVTRGHYHAHAEKAFLFVKASK